LPKNFKPHYTYISLCAICGEDYSKYYEKANNCTNNLQEMKKGANFAAPYNKLACTKNGVLMMNHF